MTFASHSSGCRKPSTKIDPQTTDRGKVQLGHTHTHKVCRRPWRGSVPDVFTGHAEPKDLWCHICQDLLRKFDDQYKTERGIDLVPIGDAQPQLGEKDAQMYERFAEDPAPAIAIIGGWKHSRCTWFFVASYFNIIPKCYHKRYSTGW